MILRGVHCVGGRAGVLKVGASLPRHFASSSQVRLFSLGGLQRAVPSSARVGLFNAPGSSRNISWWSKGSRPEPTTSTQSTEFVADTVTDTPPAEVATLVESTNALNAAPVSGTPELAEAAADAFASPMSNSALDAVARVPMQYGDLAALGLCHWTPAGLSQWGLEALHVATGLPWFWTIVAGTVVSRLIVLPFALKGIRNAALMAPHQAEFEKLREEINQARLARDTAHMQRMVLKQQVLYKKIGVSMAGMVLPPFVQLPVTLGMFFGIKRMCDVGVPQLKYDSGVSLWPDLTVPDPTYILPIVSTAVMNLSLSLGMRDMSASESMPHLINLFRVLSTVGILFLINLPTAVVVHLFTGVSWMALQSAALRVPAVRSALNIPLRPAGAGVKSASLLDSVRYVKQMWEKKKAEEIASIRMKERRR